VFLSVYGHRWMYLKAAVVARKKSIVTEICFERLWSRLKKLTFWDSDSTISNGNTENWECKQFLWDSFHFIFGFGFLFRVISMISDFGIDETEVTCRETTKRGKKMMRGKWPTWWPEVLKKWILWEGQRILGFTSKNALFVVSGACKLCVPCGQGCCVYWSDIYRDVGPRYASCSLSVLQLLPLDQRLSVLGYFWRSRYICGLAYHYWWLRRSHRDLPIRGLQLLLPDAFGNPAHDVNKELRRWKQKFVLSRRILQFRLQDILGCKPSGRPRMPVRSTWRWSHHWSRWCI
jgi:hypothetical protein